MSKFLILITSFMYVCVCFSFQISSCYLCKFSNLPHKLLSDVEKNLRTILNARKIKAFSLLGEGEPTKFLMKFWYIRKKFRIAWKNFNIAHNIRGDRNYKILRCIFLFLERSGMRRYTSLATLMYATKKLDRARTLIPSCSPSPKRENSWIQERRQQKGKRYTSGVAKPREIL